MNTADKLSRQRRRRLDRLAERQLRQSDRALEQKGLVTIPIEAVQSMETMQRFFVGIVREQGRVRVSKATLDALQKGDTVKRSDAGDYIILTYQAAGAPAPEEGSNEP